MSFDRTLRRYARRLPEYPVPSGLRPRLMERLEIDGHRAPLALGIGARIAVGAVLVSVCGLGIQAYRQFAAPSVSMVNAAALQVNTWHFVGWQIKDGKRVRWEVWGRRSPSFYREEIGDDITIGFPEQTIQTLPSFWRNEVGGRIYLTQKPKKLEAYYARDRRLSLLAGTTMNLLPDDRYRTIEAQKTWIGNTPVHLLLQSGEHRSELIQLQTDRKTHLPIQIEERDLYSNRVVADRKPAKQRSTYGQQNTDEGEGGPVYRDSGDLVKASKQAPTVAVLKADYNVPIPSDKARFDAPSVSSLLSMQVSSPKGASRISGGISLMPGNAGSVKTKETTFPLLPAPTISQGTEYPGQTSYPSSGIDIQASNLQIDEKGNIRVRLAVHMGDQPFQFARQHLNMELSWTSACLRDATGRQIPLIYDPTTDRVQGNVKEILLLAAEPVSRKDLVSMQLTMQGNYMIPLYLEGHSLKNPGDIAMIGGRFGVIAPVAERDFQEKVVPERETSSVSLHRDLLRVLLCQRASQIAKSYASPTLKQSDNIREQLASNAERYRHLANYWCDKAASSCKSDADKAAVAKARKDVADMWVQFQQPYPK